MQYGNPTIKQKGMNQFKTNGTSQKGLFKRKKKRKMFSIIRHKY